MRDLILQLSKSSIYSTKPPCFCNVKGCEGMHIPRLKSLYLLCFFLKRTIFSYSGSDITFPISSLDDAIFLTLPDIDVLEKLANSKSLFSDVTIT
ncbi:TPA: hypothetical protein ACJ6SX_13935 [Klebsiella pneumoniae]|nr:hypothetical protein D9K84_22370 [Klebsiella pneumoniae]